MGTGKRSNLQTFPRRYSNTVCAAINDYPLDKREQKLQPPKSWRGLLAHNLTFGA